MHRLNMIQGDYIFYAWKDGEDKRYEDTVKELESKGFKFKSSEVEFQDMYNYYEDAEGNRVTVTECLV